jgi:DmsE family decaheme c-type cytochrome
MRSTEVTMSRLIQMIVWMGALGVGMTRLAAQDVAAPYVGSQICQACHEDIFNAFQKSPHHVVESDKKRGWVGKSCESCHGPAQKHTETVSAEDIRNPEKITAVASDKVCLTCHLNQPTHVGRIESSHARDQVSCVGCHPVHANGGKTLVTRAPVASNEKCASCHVNVWAAFQKPNHHRVPEGAMSCVDCHNPHGSISKAMTQIYAANDRGCIGCHGDKRGPFTFEHAPVRFEGCGSCHEPHGSVNPRMLIRHEVRLVCLECHANLPTAPVAGVVGVVPPSFHNLNSPRYQNCTVCHQKIHGSYVDRSLLK